MKVIIKQILSVKVIGNLLQKLLYPFAKAYGVVLWENQRNNIKQSSKSISEISRLSRELKNIQSSLKENLVVRNGVFSGMIYDSFSSTGSTIYPKLLGSYEKEISNIVENLVKRNYELIVDVGCAEGYYAVGLARHFKDKETEVVAFDTDKNARLLCSLNSKINSVRIKINDFCDSKKLENLCSKKYSLIIIDAEGYELELLNRKIIKKLKHCDFLIESHDFVNIESTEYLVNCFKNTHTTEIIKSVDDISKAYEYEFSELKNLHLQTKFDLLRECRTGIMKWVFADSKSH